MLETFQKEYLLTETNFTFRGYTYLERRVISLFPGSGNFHICFHFELKNDN